MTSWDEEATTRLSDLMIMTAVVLPMTRRDASRGPRRGDHARLGRAIHAARWSASRGRGGGG